MIRLDEHTCPRCLGGIPTNTERGAYPGALSRTDNLTEVCTLCGLLEAFEAIIDKPTEQKDWKVFK